LTAGPDKVPLRIGSTGGDVSRENRRLEDLRAEKTEGRANCIVDRLGWELGPRDGRDGDER
jgi:hypothetical protein